MANQRVTRSGMICVITEHAPLERVIARQAHVVSQIHPAGLATD